MDPTELGASIEQVGRARDQVVTAVAETPGLSWVTIRATG